MSRADADAVPPIDIEPAHWRIVRDILHRHVPDRGVWAFGSRARFTARPFSDLDLAILGSEPLSLDRRARLSEAFSESDLPYRVDILDWAAADEAFRKRIEGDGVVLSPQARPSSERATTSFMISELPP